MKFQPTPLQGSYLIDVIKLEDSRGFFSRAFSVEDFEKKGLETHFVQFNNSLSHKKGTLRGMHYQLPPSSEVKLVRCIRGSLYDVILDLRENSPTFGKSFGAKLSADNRRMMYVPKGFAHGFLTLTDDAEVFYAVSNTYDNELERGIRWNDPTFQIEWPFEPVVLSDRDLQHPDYNPSYHLNQANS